LRAERGNLSFFSLLAVERRDRFVPRDDIFHLSLRAERGNLSFICLPALKGEIATYLAMTSFLCHCEPAKQSLFYPFASSEGRDRFVPRDDIFHLSLRACEAISPFSVCQL
jgi:hypothetical protein